MCTSIVVNKKKTIVGWNLDIMDFEYRVRPTDDGVYIEINDATERTVYWCYNRNYDQIETKRFLR